MSLKNRKFILFLIASLAIIGACTKIKDHVEIENPYANQVLQITYSEYISNLANHNIYPFKALGIQFVNTDSLATDEFCIVDGIDTTTYKEFIESGNHYFIVKNINGDTLKQGAIYIDKYITPVFFYNSVFPLSYFYGASKIWKPIRSKSDVPPFYSEYYEIRDYQMNSIFSSTSFDSAWTAQNSHGPYYYYARYVDWYGKVYEKRGEIAVLN